MSRAGLAITSFEGQAEDIEEKCWQSHHLIAELWLMRYLFLSLHFSVNLYWAKLLLKSIHLDLLSSWCQYGPCLLSSQKIKCNLSNIVLVCYLVKPKKDKNLAFQKQMMHIFTT